MPDVLIDGRTMIQAGRYLFDLLTEFGENGGLGPKDAGRNVGHVKANDSRQHFRIPLCGVPFSAQSFECAKPLGQVLPASPVVLEREHVYRNTGDRGSGPHRGASKPPRNPEVKDPQRYMRPSWGRARQAGGNGVTHRIEVTAY